MSACKRCELFTVEARGTENGPFTVVSPIWGKLSQATGYNVIMYMNAIFIHPSPAQYTSSLRRLSVCVTICYILTNAAIKF